MVLKYEATSDLYKAKLKNVRHLCLTMDIWTETMAEKGYLGITAHYLEGTDFRSINLSVKQMTTNHTAENIKTAVLETIAEWDIENAKVVSVVTDNANNMIAAMRKAFDHRRLPCFAHTLNLVTQTATSLDDINDVIIKIRSIVKYFKNSVNASDKLRKVQTASGVAEGNVLMLQKDVPTRWNSKFYMIDRFMDMRKIVADILMDDSNGPPMLTSTELELSKQLLQLLKPFEFVTRDISGQKYVTLSKNYSDCAMPPI
ncbi:E3 SUMO-protein ligase ZBED1-like [Armigeres subalbatus]|uniref:E3 SUMO-protein ligase ZBED1-like n=1 Tax=Armigeres subalbatus TaxID=124917 RepID=UPI002ED298C2